MVVIRESMDCNDVVMIDSDGARYPVKANPHYLLILMKIDALKAGRRAECVEKSKLIVEGRELVVTPRLDGANLRWFTFMDRFTNFNVPGKRQVDGNRAELQSPGGTTFVIINNALEREMVESYLEVMPKSTEHPERLITRTQLRAATSSNFIAAI